MPAPASAPAACEKCGFKPAEAANFCPRCGQDMRGLSATNDTLAGGQIGKVIADRYRIRERIGEGGMGAVYKVEHTRMGKVLALKLMRPEFAADKQAVERFVAEAHIVSRLTHIHTISVFDFGETDEKALYIAMEYVPGKDLAWLLRVEGRVPERRAATICAQVLRSLAEAHDVGIIHRDVKPGNVMLLKSREGEDFVKVLDFGIAKLAQGRREPGKAITGTGEFIGTPNYMSPEQAKGGELGPPSDLYSVGAMLFELVTGQIPFNAPTPFAIIGKHIAEPPPSPRQVAPEAGISPALEAIILRALAKDPKDRYASADEMREALEQAAQVTPRRRLTKESVEAGDTSVDLASREDWDRFEKDLRGQMARRRMLPWLVVLLMLAMGGLGLTYRVELQQLLLEVRKSRPITDNEIEPNNSPNDANEIRAGAPVRGTMFGRVDNEGDRDTFAVTLPQGEHLATVRLGSIPDINLQLFLYDAQGKNPLKFDAAPAGEGEVATRVAVKERMFIQVRQNADGGIPKENSVDTYSLQVQLLPPDPEWEVEPNDDWSRANPLPVGQVRKGIAGAGKARDAWVVEPPPGLDVTGVLVTGVRGVDLVLQTTKEPEEGVLKQQLHNQNGPGAGEVAPLPKDGGKVYVYVEVLSGAEHESPYELVAFADVDGATLVATSERLKRQERFLDVAVLNERAAARWASSPAAPELLWDAALASLAGAKKLSEQGVETLGYEADPKKREQLFRAFAGLEPWHKSGIKLRYSPAKGGYVYAGEAYRRIVLGYKSHARAEAASAALVELEQSPCGAAAVAKRADEFVERFPESDYRRGVLLALARAQEDLGRQPGAPGDAARRTAVATYRRIGKDFGGTVEAQAADERLRALRDRDTRSSSALYFPCD